MGDNIQIGSTKLQVNNESVEGDFVTINGESFYRISNYDKMDPFFMTIVSSTDLWMYISSNGGLTAGRKNPDNALFPYYTVDKIHDGSENTGAKTIIIHSNGSAKRVWEPFSERYSGVYHINRSIYKSVIGNSIIFQEINQDLQLSFSYQWMSSDKFGFVRKATITNLADKGVQINLLDGIQNILPSGIDKQFQQSYSNLIDAYKKNELLVETGIGLYMLSSVIVDKAEPSEALSTTLVWSVGIENASYLLCDKQVNAFRKGKAIRQEADIRAERGAYFIQSAFELPATTENSWYIVADVNKNAGDVAQLKKMILDEKNIVNLLTEDIAVCNGELFKLLGAADGLQLTNDKLSISRHLSNVLFNIMRGGIAASNYDIEKNDFLAFIENANKQIHKKNLTFLQSLPAQLTFDELAAQINGNDDNQLVRLFYEYLPLTFSRRHGDPSRPWNQFSIETKKEDGSLNLYYQGNWRDIFQNWEALALSYPSFAEGMIAKFVNATTADGYNPYRITRDGIDWEKPDPHDPWANIGYWGDHQIVYLLKLLEISDKYHPGLLHTFLTSDIFAYADVPYRIKKYEALTQDPFNTILFDDAAELQSAEKVNRIGSDGKLLTNQQGEIVVTNLTEKLLATVLAKFSNFIPEAGIWLNTQRPEWNDANNALVGNGVSMVTLCYLRKFQSFCLRLFSDLPNEELAIADELYLFFENVSATFKKYEYLLTASISNENRRDVVDALGRAGSEYREKVYQYGFSGTKTKLQRKALIDFFETSLLHIDHSIKRNKRPDNLYHSYNLVSFSQTEITIRHLYEMLEGQVAVLSAGLLQTTEVNEVLDALKASALFRADQYSYMLYPDRQLPRFMEKNCIPENLIHNPSFPQRLLTDTAKKIIYKDVDDKFHFNAAFRNAADLSAAIYAIDCNLQFSNEEKEYLLKIYESVFDHQSFTGRSGTFYGYEGLGCIYWHMVSKLLLAINENYFTALTTGASEIELSRLITHYYDVRAGIGFNKSPELFGAFPTDAYSHTPGNGGAKQPGMTGQVKEDIIARFGEVGVHIEEGKMVFNPGLLRKSEFLTAPCPFNYISLDNKTETISLLENTLAFTVCQVPVIYNLSDINKIEILTTDNQLVQLDGLTLDEAYSKLLFSRSGKVKQITVFLTPRLA